MSFSGSHQKAMHGVVSLPQRDVVLGALQRSESVEWKAESCRTSLSENNLSAREVGRSTFWGATASDGFCVARIHCTVLTVGVEYEI